MKHDRNRGGNSHTRRLARRAKERAARAISYTFHIDWRGFHEMCAMLARLFNAAIAWFGAVFSTAAPFTAAAGTIAEGLGYTSYARQLPERCAA